MTSVPGVPGTVPGAVVTVCDRALRSRRGTGHSHSQNAAQYEGGVRHGGAAQPFEAAKPGTASLLRARAIELRAIAADLEAQADAEDRQGAAQRAQALDLGALAEEFGFSRQSLASAAAHGLPVHRGPRGRLMAFREDVEAWIRSRAWTPRRRQAEGLSDAELEQAEGDFLASIGCGTRSHQPKQATSEAPARNSGASVTPIRALTGGGK